MATVTATCVVCVGFDDAVRRHESLTCPGSVRMVYAWKGG